MDGSQTSAWAALIAAVIAAIVRWFYVEYRRRKEWQENQTLRILKDQAERILKDVAKPDEKE
ncbi:MAG: hypothetical protein GXP27_14320 [Planctomycetes bacterium]|nr:hypothetical protein [Planctomycetota bacterium]